MTERVVVKLEQRRREAVARTYEAKGYTVVRAPQDDALPDALHASHPDLLAYNDDERVIVQVRSRASLVGAQELEALARAVEGMPGWRLELDVVNPRPSVARETGGIALADDEISRHVTNAQRLFDVQPEAALLLAWAAAEATLRLLARHYRIQVAREQPRAIVKKLYMYGVLGEDDADVFFASIRFRDGLIHGYRVPDLKDAPLAQLAATIARLLHATDGAQQIA